MIKSNITSMDTYLVKAIVALCMYHSPHNISVIKNNAVLYNHAGQVIADISTVEEARNILLAEQSNNIYAARAIQILDGELYGLYDAYDEINGFAGISMDRRYISVIKTDNNDLSFAYNTAEIEDADASRDAAELIEHLTNAANKAEQLFTNEIKNVKIIR